MGARQQYQTVLVICKMCFCYSWNRFLNTFAQDISWFNSFIFVLGAGISSKGVFFSSSMIKRGSKQKQLFRDMRHSVRARHKLMSSLTAVQVKVQKNPEYFKKQLTVSHCSDLTDWGELTAVKDDFVFETKAKVVLSTYYYTSLLYCKNDCAVNHYFTIFMLRVDSFAAWS